MEYIMSNSPINLCTGSGFNRRVARKSDMQKNIDAIQRYIDDQQRSIDFVSLIDTKSILVGLQKQLLN